MEKVGAAQMEIVTPVTAGAVPSKQPAERGSDRLERTWGFVDTSKVNANIFIQHLTELVRQRHGVSSVVVKKPAPGVGLTQEQEELLASRCGVVVTCFGD